MDVLDLNLSPCIKFLSRISQVLTLKQSIQNFQLHTRTHHIDIIVIIVVLTLCYSIISHSTLILYYHASMLTSGAL